MNMFKQVIAFSGFIISTLFPVKAMPIETNKTAYDFAFEALTGGELPLSAYRGKIILIVNTASKCGFTSQYKGLESLYKEYAGKGLIIVGVPANNFGAQEPGTASEIKAFCELNYGVTFPMTAKVDVVGDNAHPFYRWAKEVLGEGAAPKWNFHKYLIDRNGKLVNFFGSMTGPDSKKLTNEIDKLL